LTILYRDVVVLVCGALRDFVERYCNLRKERKNKTAWHSDRRSVFMV